MNFTTRQAVHCARGCMRSGKHIPISGMQLVATLTLLGPPYTYSCTFRSTWTVQAWKAERMCMLRPAGKSFGPGLSNAAPVIYFPGALIYSAGFNVNQNVKKKIFLNDSMFQLFS
jgi:hypothetical protein